VFNHSTLVEPIGLTRSWPRNARAELFVTVNVISPRPSPPVGTRSLAVVMAKILFMVKLRMSFQIRVHRSHERVSPIRQSARSAPDEVSRRPERSLANERGSAPRQVTVPRSARYQAPKLRC